MTRLLVLDPVSGFYGWRQECEIADNWDAVYEAVKQPQFRVSVEIDEPCPDILEHACNIVRDDEVRDCTLVVDELYYFFRKRQDAPEYIQELFRFGRRELIDVVFITQRPVDCPVDLRSMFTDIYVFSLFDPSDADWLKGAIGKANASKLVDVHWHEYYHWSLKTRECILVRPDVQGGKRELQESVSDRRGERRGHLSGSQGGRDSDELPRLDEGSDEEEIE